MTPQPVLSLPLPTSDSRSPERSPRTSSKTRARLTPTLPVDFQAPSVPGLANHLGGDRFERNVTSQPEASEIPGHPETLEALVHQLAAQQNVIEASAIEAAVQTAFPDPVKQSLAMEVLTQITRLASMKSLSAVQSALIQYQKESKHRIYYQGEATLGSTLNYLALKHKTPSSLPSPFLREAVTEAQNLASVTQGAILLDQRTQARLAQDPALCQHIREHQIRLLYPQGWDEGINPFNQVPLDELLKKTQVVMERVASLQAHSQNLSEQEAIGQAVSQPTRYLLKTLQLDPLLTEIKPQLSYVPPMARKHPSAKLVAEQLAPRQLDANQLSRILVEADEGQANLNRQALRLKILKEQAKVFSPLRMSELLRAKAQEVYSQAAQLGITPDSVLYYIDEKKKSYGLIHFHYSQLCPLRPHQIIEAPLALGGKGSKPRMLVILDDVASSGDSLVEVYHKLREQLGPKPHLYFSPLVSTQRAHQVFADIKKHDTNCTYRASQTVPLFTEHPLYQNASPGTQAHLKEAVIHLGHRENGLSLAFPYMAPDNNNGFFAQYIAPVFTLNRAGCKNIEPTKPAAKIQTPKVQWKPHFLARQSQQDCLEDLANYPI